MSTVFLVLAAGAQAAGPSLSIKAPKRWPVNKIFVLHLHAITGATDTYGYNIYLASARGNGPCATTAAAEAQHGHPLFDNGGPPNWDVTLPVHLYGSLPITITLCAYMVPKPPGYSTLNQDAQLPPVATARRAMTYYKPKH